MGPEIQKPKNEKKTQWGRQPKRVYHQSPKHQTEPNQERCADVEPIFHINLHVLELEPGKLEILAKRGPRGDTLFQWIFQFFV